MLEYLTFKGEYSMYEENNDNFIYYKFYI